MRTRRAGAGRWIAIGATCLVLSLVLFGTLAAEAGDLRAPGGFQHEEARAAPSVSVSTVSNGAQMESAVSDRVQRSPAEAVPTPIAAASRRRHSGDIVRAWIAAPTQLLANWEVLGWQFHPTTDFLPPAVEDAARAVIAGAQAEAEALDRTHAETSAREFGEAVEKGLVVLVDLEARSGRLALLPLGADPFYRRDGTLCYGVAAEHMPVARDERARLRQVGRQAVNEVARLCVEAGVLEPLERERMATEAARAAP